MAADNVAAAAAAAAAIVVDADVDGDGDSDGGGDDVNYGDAMIERQHLLKYLWNCSFRINPVTLLSQHHQDPGAPCDP